MMDANLRVIHRNRLAVRPQVDPPARLAEGRTGNCFAMELPTKACAICGRTITWRKKWARDWDAVRYCSDACRSRRLTALDAQLEQAILAKLADRSATATICPSEVARDLGGAGWKDLMEPTRQAARRLVVAGEVEITQKGRTVDPSTAKGPIRIRRTS